MSRIEVILKNPNPLFEKWLIEWLDEAKEKNLKSVRVLEEALRSLRSFPLPLASGKECFILRGFGTTLCALLDQKLEEYKKIDIEGFNQSINFKEDIATVTKTIERNMRKKNVSPRKVSPEKTKKKTKSNLNLKVQEDNVQFIMNSGEFDIMLIVDTQETNGKFKTALDETRSYLEKNNILHEIRRLSVGDFAWICRDKDKNELILPYIVERKRMDDFASSIRDGRFHEQKFRLKNSGIQNIIYLIESYGSNKHIGLPLSNLMQAAVNTQIHHGFQVKFTDNHQESLFYLSTLSKIFIRKFKEKVLISTEKEDLQPFSLEAPIIGLMKFNKFQLSSSKSKNLKIREIFIKQLLQLKSLSFDKGLAITQIYSTPQSLLLAYKSCDTKEEAERLLADIPSGKLKRPVGLQISKILYQFYNEKF